MIAEQLRKRLERAAAREGKQRERAEHWKSVAQANGRRIRRLERELEIERMRLGEWRAKLLRLQGELVMERQRKAA